MNEQQLLTPQDIAALKQEILSSLHCSMPGTVESFDPVTQTASVRPALKKGSFLLPVIHNIPVFFPGSRTGGITWPVSAGDECLLVFADFDIDRWFSSGSAEEPDSARQHDLPDAFAFVGFRSRPNVLADFDQRAGMFSCGQLALRMANGLLTGSGTAGQAGSSSVTYIPTRWTFDLDFTPVPGDTITITVPVAGVNAGVWISVDNGGTYLPVATMGASILTTHFGVGQMITLVYQEGLSTTVYPLAGGTATTTWTGGRWCVLNFYNSNTTYSNASLGQGYGTCATAEATAAKAVTLSSYALVTGGYVAVKFTYAVPASATLNVNSKGAKPIYYKGAALTAGIIQAGDTATFVYNGSQYHLVAIDRQTHDDRYYTETEVDTKLSGKKNTQTAVSDPSASGTSATFIATLSQNAQGVITPTKKTVRTMTAATADAAGTTGLVPAPAKGAQGKFLKGNATWATPAVSEGGTGMTGTGATTTIADIATAASGCEITTAQYAYWGKVAMVRLVVKKTAAVTSGTTTLCTLVSGKRPKYNAMGMWAWNNGAQISTAGAVQVNGAISANASLTILATYVLA